MSYNQNNMYTINIRIYNVPTSIIYNILIINNNTKKKPHVVSLISFLIKLCLVDY